MKDRFVIISEEGLEQLAFKSAMQALSNFYENGPAFKCNGKELMNLQEAADSLGLKPSTIHTKMGEKEITGHKQANKWHFFYSESSTTSEIYIWNHFEDDDRTNIT